jgi:hypothetical protein
MRQREEKEKSEYASRVVTSQRDDLAQLSPWGR